MKVDQYESILEEQNALLCEAKRVFEIDECDGEMIMQIKSEVWGGEFIDLRNDEAVPDKSILRMVAKVCNVIKVIILLAILSYVAISCLGHSILAYSDVDGYHFSQKKVFRHACIQAGGPAIKCNLECP